jgi:hypothetical protein
MMVSFLKSSHGLALQRRSGRDENLIHSGSKIRKHDTIWRHIYVFLFMMLSVGSASNFAFQENELTPEFYNQFDSNYEANPSNLSEGTLREIMGVWHCQSYYGPSKTEIESESDVSGTKIKTTFQQCVYYDEIQMKPEYKTGFEDKKTMPVLLNNDTRLVLLIKQGDAFWIITPMKNSEDKTFLRWHSNQTFKKKKHRQIDFDYYKPESQLSAIATEFQPVESQLSAIATEYQPTEPRPTPQREVRQATHQEVVGQVIDLCGIESGSENEGTSESDGGNGPTDGERSDDDNAKPLSHIKFADPKKGIKKQDKRTTGSWFCLNKSCKGQDCHIDGDSNVVYHTVKKLLKQDFELRNLAKKLIPATWNWPRESVCYKCKSRKDDDVYVLKEVLEEVKGSLKFRSASVSKVPRAVTRF